MSETFVTPRAFFQYATEMMKTAVGFSSSTSQYRFRALFGVSPAICAIIWDKLAEQGRFPNAARPWHLLWALLFLKFYAVETVNKVITGADEKTFRKWSWTFVHLISELSVIDFNQRFPCVLREKCLLSVDGTDFRIFEPYPFDAKWYSHKFNGPGLRYEVGVSIGSGRIVWAHGPFPCGSFSDVRIFRSGLKKALDEDELAIADGGYNDEQCTKLGDTDLLSKFYSVVRARHEVVNRRFKQFAVLGNRFRHSLDLHYACFHAVCNITEIMIENNEPLFNIF